MEDGAVAVKKYRKVQNFYFPKNMNISFEVKKDKKILQKIKIDFSNLSAEKIQDSVFTSW
jgi:hypothetical protein